MRILPSKKLSPKRFPIFGNIDKIILKIKPKVEVGEKLTFMFDADSLKEVFKLYGLNPDKYTLFNEDGIDNNEMIPLLTHLCQNHEERINKLEDSVDEIKEKIK